MLEKTAIGFLASEEKSIHMKKSANEYGESAKDMQKET